MNLKKITRKVNDCGVTTTMDNIPLVAGHYGRGGDGEKSLDRHYGGFQRTKKVSF